METLGLFKEKIKKSKFLKNMKHEMLLKKMTLQELCNLVNEIDGYYSEITNDKRIVILYNTMPNLPNKSCGKFFKQGIFNFILNKHPNYKRD